jgi:hypothetical protein
VWRTGFPFGGGYTNLTPSTYPILRNTRRGDGLVVWGGLLNTPASPYAVGITANLFEKETVPRANRIIMASFSNLTRSRTDFMGFDELTRGATGIQMISGGGVSSWLSFDSIRYVP